MKKTTKECLETLPIDFFYREDVKLPYKFDYKVLHFMRLLVAQKKLTIKDAEILVLKSLGFEESHVSTLFNIPKTTSYSRGERALTKLRKIFGYENRSNFPFVLTTFLYDWIYNNTNS